MTAPVREKDTAAGPQAEPEVRMTLGEHLEELRQRLFKSLIALLAALVLAMVFYDRLISFVTKPHFHAMQLLQVPPDQSKFLAKEYTSPVIAVMKLAFIVALFVASPFVGYQMWAFVSAGLYRHEKKGVLRFAPVSFFLFIGGCAFGYFVLVPYALYGLARLMPLDKVAPMYSFSEYLSLVMTLTIILGGIFQMPLLMVFFARIGLVRPSTYNRWRRNAIVGNFVFAALITPPDVFTMILVAIPLVVLYEIGVVCSYLTVPSATSRA